MLFHDSFDNRVSCMQPLARHGETKETKTVSEYHGNDKKGKPFAMI